MKISRLQLGLQDIKEEPNDSDSNKDEEFKSMKSDEDQPVVVDRDNVFGV
jgi:hypothetical protein